MSAWFIVGTWLACLAFSLAMWVLWIAGLVHVARWLELI